MAGAPTLSSSSPDAILLPSDWPQSPTLKGNLNRSLFTQQLLLLDVVKVSVSFVAISGAESFQISDYFLSLSLCIRCLTTPKKRG